MLLPPRALRAWFRRQMQGGPSVAALLTTGPVVARLHRCRNERLMRTCRAKVTHLNNVEVDMEGAPEVESVLQPERASAAAPPIARGGREAATQVAAAREEHARRREAGR